MKQWVCNRFMVVGTLRQIQHAYGGALTAVVYIDNSGKFGVDQCVLLNKPKRVWFRLASMRLITSSSISSSLSLTPVVYHITVNIPMTAVSTHLCRQHIKRDFRVPVNPGASTLTRSWPEYPLPASPLSVAKVPRAARTNPSQTRVQRRFLIEEHLALHTDHIGMMEIVPQLAPGPGAVPR